MRKYYEAYDDRYRQVHEENLAWFSRCPSAIVAQVISRYELPVEAKMLEIGCGEGRDAKYLLERGYDLLATDASSEAVDYCRKESPGYAECFQFLDCVKGRLETKYDFSSDSHAGAGRGQKWILLFYPGAADGKWDWTDLHDG